MLARAVRKHLMPYDDSTLAFEVISLALYSLRVLFGTHCHNFVNIVFGKIVL